MTKLLQHLEELRRSSDTERYPEKLDESHCCPSSGEPYHYVAGLDLRHFVVCCEGSYHKVANFPAASSSTQEVRQQPKGADWTKCKQNLQRIDEMVLAYKNRHGRYPSHLAYTVEKPGDHLPSCDGTGVRAPNETDYAIMLNGEYYHLVCTSVNHLKSGMGPLQPGLINGLPPKAMFFLKTRWNSESGPEPRRP